MLVLSLSKTNVICMRTSDGPVLIKLSDDVALKNIRLVFDLPDDVRVDRRECLGCGNGKIVVGPPSAVGGRDKKKKELSR